MIRKGVAALIFLREEKEIKYLLLKRKKNWVGWEWLKGGCKKGEDEKTCLAREIGEESGITDFKAVKTKFVHTFIYPKQLAKDEQEWGGAAHRIYLVESFSDEIGLDNDEHSDYEWFSEGDALKMLTWADQKKVFRRIIKDYLKKKTRKK